MKTLSFSFIKEDFGHGNGNQFYSMIFKHVKNNFMILKSCFWIKWNQTLLHKRNWNQAST
jgi:hypothetical protein